MLALTLSLAVAMAGVRLTAHAQAPDTATPSAAPSGPFSAGEAAFDYHCAPCHGRTGDGKGMVVCKRDKPTDPCESRGFPPLPSYEDPRIRHMPDGQLFATITHGVRTMPAYGPQVPIADRWAIVSYVRALELDQMAETKPSQPEPKK